MSNFKAKMHQFDYRWGSTPDLTQRSLAVFKGPTSKERDGKGKGMRKRKVGWEREGKAEGRTTLCTPCRKFLATPLVDLCHRFPEYVMGIKSSAVSFLRTNVITNY